MLATATTKSVILIDSFITTGAPCLDGQVISTRHGGLQMVGAVFKAGTYARTPDGIVYIQGCDGGRYLTISTERDEEHKYSRSKLAAWSPKAGERVTEIDNDSSPVGIVIEAGEEISLVRWDCLLRQLSWINSCLEPVWID
jgi:hypothetical protein